MIGESLHIVVCVKQTLSSTNAPYDPKTGAVLLAQAQAAVNPFDEYAVEEGVRIKERLNGKAVVSALTLGPPEAESVLREVISRGCDAGYLLTDPAFRGSDTYGTSYLLSCGVRRISGQAGPVDLVLCGKQTNDSDTGQVGLGLAAWLDIPSATLVKKVAELYPPQGTNPGRVVVHRAAEEGVDILELDLPALFSVIKEINEPRLSSLKGKMAAKKAEIPRWGASDLQADLSRVGESGSLWRIGEPIKPPQRSGGEKIAGGTIQEQAKNLVARLKELGLV